MKMVLYICSPSTKTHNPTLIMKKTSDNYKLRRTLQNTCLMYLKTLKVIKNKENLRNCHSQEEPKRRNN